MRFQQWRIWITSNDVIGIPRVTYAFTFATYPTRTRRGTYLSGPPLVIT
jgi:hypothetical protein